MDTDAEMVMNQEKKDSTSVQVITTLNNERVVLLREDVPLDQVFLDPDNPRVRHQAAHKDKLDKTSNQALYKLLMDFQDVDKVYKLVRDHGGLITPIHITYEGKVVEGNCRTASFMRLRETYPGDPRWQKIPAWRLPQGFSEKEIAIFQGVEHIAGKLKWPAYEKAGHVYRLHTDHKVPKAEIAKRLGMKDTEVETLLTAFKTMSEKLRPAMGKKFDIEKFSYVLEFYKHKHAKVVEFRQEPENVDLFIGLVARDGNEKCFTKGQEVRRLHEVLQAPRALDALKKHNFEKAMEVVGRHNPAADSALFHDIAALTETLSPENVGQEDLKRLRDRPKEQDLLRNLYKAIEDLAAEAHVDLKPKPHTRGR